MKKLLTAILTLGLVFAPISISVFQDQVTTVEAKSYRSGKKSFNTNKSNSNSSLFQKKDNTTKNSTTNGTAAKKSGGLFSGGLMKGLMVGGLAGLLFGSMFANMGVLGSILGFMINVAAIVVLISVIRKIFTFFKNKKKEEANHWRN